jgi:hypothetical protein
MTPWLATVHGVNVELTRALTTDEFKQASDVAAEHSPFTNDIHAALICWFGPILSPYQGGMDVAVIRSMMSKTVVGFPGRFKVGPFSRGRQSIVTPHKVLFHGMPITLTRELSRDEFHQARRGTADIQDRDELLAAIFRWFEPILHQDQDGTHVSNVRSYLFTKVPGFPGAFQVGPLGPLAEATISIECPECWGTGLFKGWGAPCSNGCKQP